MRRKKKKNEEHIGSRQERELAQPTNLIVIDPRRLLVDG
jgi:hypothetical protein